MRFLNALSLLIPVASAVSYDGYKVFRVKTGAQHAVVESKLQVIQFDQWSHDTAHMDIVVSPDQIATFEAIEGLDYSVMHEDLGASITAESAPTSTWKRQISDDSWFDTYHPYADHIEYWKALHESFPSNSEWLSEGKSGEGRELFGLHLWGKSGPGKPAVLWHSTVHAREWITTMVVEYLAKQLVTGYGKDNLTTSFLDRYDFYIIPFVNPDGFVYSQTQDRLWRKNRQRPPCSTNSTCVGRDINRNWPYKWGSNPLGASTNPCSQTYQGASAGDTPEVKGLKPLTDRLRDGAGIRLFIDWHSYGQYILAPVGFNCTYYVPNLGQHINMAQQASDEIRDTNGKTFTFGPSCGTLYATTGSAPDYAWGGGNAKYAYTIELRDTGTYGFVLPPDQIRPSAEEQWNGMSRVFLRLLDEVFFDGIGPA